ncbi:Gfo/Idh/MocA family oxidoreductase [Nitrosopumilus sp.]|nr:Gfo/Idh/MocA family oxidoreductase [Nitrosopumilus sp.]
MKFHVIGSGSIGQRHIHNLLKIGQNVTIYDSDTTLAKKISKKLGVQYVNSIVPENMDCICICTPPSSHVDLAKKAIKKNSHVFIEKPLSDSKKNMSEFLRLSKKNKSKIFVGYSFRFDKGLQKIQSLLKKNTIGKIISFDAYEGWYLPLWRPWQDHKKSYTGSKKLGGGIILDGSHELNYLLWLGGGVSQVFCYHTTIQSLGVKTEGLAEILLKFKSKAIGRIHLDFVNPKYNRYCEILGEKGSIRWNFDTKKIEIQKSGASKFKSITYGIDSNQMYVDEMKYVISCISGKKKNDLITFDSAKKTLDISLAIKKSGNTGRAVLV